MAYFGFECSLIVCFVGDSLKAFLWLGFVYSHEHCRVTLEFNRFVVTFGVWGGGNGAGGVLESDDLDGLCWVLARCRRF